MGIVEKLNSYASFKDTDVFQPGQFNPGVFDTNKKTRLLTVNWFDGYGKVKKNKDLDYGPRCNTKYKSFGPLIAELYTDNTERIPRKKAEIPEEMWQYTETLGKQYMAAHPGVARNGCGPRFKDAQPIEKLKMKCKLDF